MEGNIEGEAAPKLARGPLVLLAFFALVTIAGVALWQVAVAQRGKNPPLTLERLEVAQQRWLQDRPENYSLQIRLFGQHGGLLKVNVNGEHAQLEADPPKLLEKGSSDFWNPNAWTVDGMFVRLRRDMDIVANPDFVPPAGTAAPAHGYKTLRADFDNRLGYITTYKRPQLDQLPSLQWRVESFESLPGS